MLIKDKDILAEDSSADMPQKPARHGIDKENMKSAWGDAFDYYLRDITGGYIKFFGRATRIEFWGYIVVANILFFALYPLGYYIDMPTFAYYFALVTAVPGLAVTTRRLHDIGKNALIYLGIPLIFIASAFFIGWYAVILLLLWVSWLIKLLSEESDPEEGIYGAPNQNDEIYEADNLPIIRKFRTLAITLSALWLILAYINFDKWNTQEQYAAMNDTIMEKIEETGKASGLNAQQIEAAQGIMKQTLRAWNGQTVDEKEIEKAISGALQSLQKPKAAPAKK